MTIHMTQAVLLDTPRALATSTAPIASSHSSRFSATNSLMEPLAPMFQTLKTTLEIQPMQCCLRLGWCLKTSQLSYAGSAKSAQQHLQVLGGA
eukprot:10758120-Lingulodinium_polyedra.AAC.3